MNVYDTEIVISILRGAGFIEAKEIEDANILFLNTCAIRENAVDRIVHKMSQYWHYYKRTNLEITGIIGCIPQHNSEGIKKRLSFVNILAGPDSYRELPKMIQNVYKKKDHFCSNIDFDTEENYDYIFPSRKRGTNAFISIIRGCNNFCSYCVVPYTRGRERSRSVELIILEAEKSVSEGYHEITLLGQNVNSYNFEGVSFPELLQKVAGVKGVERLRFATSHPKDLSEELLKVIAANKNICNSIHLPFQSGSNEVLKKMKRGYTIEHYLEKIKKIKEMIPDVVLSADVIVGFPSETEEDFLKTLEVIKSVRFDNSYTFIYSEREGTFSAKQYEDDVPFEVKGERLRRLVEIQNEIGLEERLKEVGKKMPILIESVARKNENQLKGRTEHNRSVLIDKKDNIEIGDFVEVEIVRAAGMSLFGNVI